jgi:hypothetical protein
MWPCAEAKEMKASRYMRHFNHEIFRAASHVDMQKLREAWDFVIAKNDTLLARS